MIITFFPKRRGISNQELAHSSNAGLKHLKFRRRRGAVARISPKHREPMEALGPPQFSHMREVKETWILKPRSSTLPGILGF